MIKRKDLTDISDKDYGQRRGEFMQCQDCGHMFSGTRGSFSTMGADDVFLCAVCGSENIALCQRMEKIVILKQKGE